MASDSQLVALAQAGSQDAFAELLRRYSTPVFRLAVSILGQHFVPEAEDVTQEVFLKVHAALPSFRGDAQFSSWLYRITFHQAVNRKALARFRKPHSEEAPLLQLLSPDPSPLNLAQAAQRAKILSESIQSLPELYQSALRLHYWLGTPTSEIATLLDVPENTVKSWLHRSRQLLKSMLNQKGISCD